ncbi:MAG: TonB-dependent receptor [Chitinophagaceae bacterium]|nr:TonB-dependent receptor [Chitinophagaceae bacterium]
MLRIYLSLGLLSMTASGIAQEKNIKKDTAFKEISLEEVVISASNFSEKKKNIAQKIEVISGKTIAQTNAQNTGDLLMSTGNVFVQKSQQGGSSPVLRGFEASRILIVIDGVRMNNAIYRSGHLQNVITADQNSLSRLEVMYGPSSTIYGSDALGGIVHLVTKSPVLSGDKKFLATGTGFVRYSSVNNEKTIHADASLGGKKLAWMQSYNYSDFGDMRMGSVYPDKYPGFGRRSTYIAQVNGVDSVMVNKDDRVQKFSGYKQWDIIQKILFQQNPRISHALNFQLSNSTDVPRYDRLQDVKNFGGSIGTTLRFAEWYYGPQKRILGAYEFNAADLGFLSKLKVNINYQDIEESRQTREYRRYDRFDSQVERVKVFGFTASGQKMMDRHELTIGLDGQFNDVKSRATRTNLTTGSVSKLNTRYPDGKNKMNNFGLFAQHLYKFKNEKLVLNDGIRFQYINLRSNVEDNSFFHLPDTAVNQKSYAFTGNIGVVYSPFRNTRIKASVSSGFRAPNIDDLSKIFESSTAAKQVVVPNASIKPEYTYNFDLTLSQGIANRVNIELTGFYTLFRNALIKAPFKLNGQDSILYNGVMSKVLANQNVNKANVYGFSFNMEAEIIKGLSFNTRFSYTRGSFKTDASKNSSVYEKQSNGTYALVSKKVSSKPLDHIPPMMGKTSLSFQHRIFYTELNLLYNGWKKLDQYNADGEDNAQYATADGMPGWMTLNWKGSVTLVKKFQVQVGVDNILDRNYRNFASGFSAGGRNFLVGLRVNW